MCDGNANEDCGVSEEGKEHVKKDKKERPQVLERQITLSNQRLLSFWVLQLGHSLHLSSMRQPCAYKTIFLPVLQASLLWVFVSVH